MPFSGVAEELMAECSAWPFAWEWGHWVALLLAAAGITKWRYGALRRLFGLGQCGCQQNEIKLNGWGAKAAALIARIRSRS